MVRHPRRGQGAPKVLTLIVKSKLKHSLIKDQLVALHSDKPVMRNRGACSSLERKRKRFPANLINQLGSDDSLVRSVGLTPIFL